MPRTRPIGAGRSIKPELLQRAAYLQAANIPSASIIQSLSITPHTLSAWRQREDYQTWLAEAKAELAVKWTTAFENSHSKAVQLFFDSLESITDAKERCDILMKFLKIAPLILPPQISNTPDQMVGDILKASHDVVTGLGDS